MMRWLCIALCLLLSLSAQAQTYRTFTLTQGGGSNPVSPSLFTSRTTGAAHWQPAAATYPIDAGVAVPVWRDFFQALRTGTYDLGAVNP